MRPASRIVGIATATLLLAAPVLAADGIQIVEKTTRGANPETNTIQIDQNRMRAETNANQVVIFDAAKQVLWMLDTGRKTYTEMTKADADRLGGQMNQMMDQMQAQLQSLPPEQRARVEAMMRGRGMGTAPPVQKTEYRRAGSGKVGSWTCDKYDGYENGKKVNEVCTVDPKVLGLTQADFAVTSQMADFFESIVPANMRQQANVFRLGDASAEGFAGVPVSRTSFDDDGKVKSTNEVVEVSRQSFDDATFAVPEGFTKRELPTMGGR